MPEIVQPTSAILTTLIQQKLTNIQNMINSGSITTREDETRNDLASLVTQAIQQFLNAIQSSDVSQMMGLVGHGSLNLSGQVTAPGTYNAFWNAVNNDLISLYAEAQSLGTVLQDNHNYVMSDVQNLLLQLKTTNATLQNYILLTQTNAKGEQSIVETFGDTLDIAFNSSLLTDQQCNVDTIQGVVTLDITDSTTVQQSDIDSVIIGTTNSNGAVYGSNTLLDTINSATFSLFQYELTSQTNALPNKLILDFTIKLNTPTILNFIRIVPNNFGTSTWPQILSLDLSMDGRNATSIKSYLLGSDSIDKNGLFTLAPSTSNYAGEGRYSFLPELAQYIHFTIQQTSPYFDTTRNLYRWAIGIKDIELDTITYGNTSQLVSNPINTSYPIAAMSMTADELPDTLYASTQIASSGNIQHDVSFDSGMSWQQTAPIYYQTDDTSVPDIVYVNSIDPSGNTKGFGHVNTQFQQNTFLYRLRMQKNISQLSDPTLAPYFTPVLRSMTFNVVAQEG